MATRIVSRTLAATCIAAGLGLGTAATAAGEQSDAGLGPVVCTVTDIDEALDPLEETLEPVTGDCPEPEPEPSPDPDPGPSPGRDPVPQPDPPTDAPDESAPQEPGDGDGTADNTSPDSLLKRQGKEVPERSRKADTTTRRAVPTMPTAPHDGGVGSAEALAATLADYSAKANDHVPQFGYLGDSDQPGRTGGMSTGWAATLKPQPAADYLLLLLATSSVAAAAAALARRWTNRRQGVAVPVANR